MLGGRGEGGRGVVSGDISVHYTDLALGGGGVCVYVGGGGG